MRFATLACAVVMSAAALAPLTAQGVPLDPAGDPPTRVGRLSTLNGAVSLYPSDATDWTDASINYPLTTGDALWADDSSRAEIQFGASAIRIGAGTSLVFGEVSDTITQLRVDQGTIEVYIHALATGESYEVDTPSGVIMLLSIGRYRIDVTPDGRRSTISVRSGGAAVQYDDGSASIAAGRSATISGATRRPIVSPAIPADSWEEWADTRDQRDDAPNAIRYVNTDMVGYQDLDQYGVWQGDATYGTVWYPRNVAADWAPYRYGHWQSIAPWGWTWIDDAPWGFAPFHYGRWAYVNRRWGWVPGQLVRQRSVYAPALVAFVGGDGWSVGASFGGRPAVGWVPLAPGEAYIPAYQASPDYLRRINTINGRMNPRPLNINDMHYANRNVPGAVTAVSRDDFTHARPIGRSAVVVPPADVARARPSAVPIAGDDRIIPPHRDGGPPPRGNRGDARPGSPPPVRAPAPPPPTRVRPRPDNVPPGDPRARQPEPPAVPPVGRPVQPPSTPPVNRPTPAPPPPQTPPPTGRGDRGRPTQPPSTPPVNPPPANTPPPPPVQPPPDRGPPVGRPRPAPRGDAAAWQERMNQLTTRHQQEDGELSKRQTFQQQHAPNGMSPEKLQQQQAAERAGLAEKHRREVETLIKQKPPG